MKDVVCEKLGCYRIADVFVEEISEFRCNQHASKGVKTAMIKLPIHRYDFDQNEIKSGDILRSLTTAGTYKVVGIMDDKLLVEALTFRSYLARRRSSPAPDGSMYEPQTRDLPVNSVQQSYIYVAQMYLVEGKEMK